MVLHPITEATRSLDAVPILFYVATLYVRHHYRPVVASWGVPYSLPIIYSLSDSDDVASLLLSPSRYRPTCYHHCRDTLAPCLRVDRSQRSRISRIAIYCATVFCLLMVYVLIPLNPASGIASSNDGYSQLSPPHL